MGLSRLITAATAFAGIASAGLVPRAFSVPNENGFPNPNAQQQRAIAQQAGGLLPNSPLPTSLDAGSATTFQLIAFNELFETAFFSSLYSNITRRVNGYQGADNRVAETIRAVIAQEESHALGAITALRNAKQFAPSPCRYSFPVNNLPDAIFFAETFTAAVLGALQGANVNFSKGGLSGVVQLISSVIGQEGEQNGFYRNYLNRIPPESPFLTYVPAAFAFSVLQTVVVPNSCPYPIRNINLPVFQPLLSNGGPIALLQPRDQTITFSADFSRVANARQYVGRRDNELYMTYTTGQQLPFSVPIENVRWRGNTLTFQANFPYEEHVMHGFSHGALTTKRNYDSFDAIVQSTIVGPALLQVNNAF